MSDSALTLGPAGPHRSPPPEVSVCIPLFNHARFLPEAIESVLAQTLRCFEIVVADDGSTDGGLQIAQAYAARYPGLIRVFAHPGNGNRGISETINLALERSSGVYVSGLAPDDLLNPDKLEKQVAFLERHPQVKWVYAQACVVDEHDRVLPDRVPFGADVTAEADPLERLIRTNLIPGMTVLCRRELLSEVGRHEPGLLYSDWEIWVRALGNSAVAFLPLVLARYRVHGANTSVGVGALTNAGRGLEVMRSLRRRAATASDRLGEPRIRATLDLQLAFYLYCLGAESEAGESLDRAFEDDASFARDGAYLSRWLRWLLYETQDVSLAAGFTGWASRRLPPGLKALSRKVSAAHSACELRRGPALGAALRCLLKDPACYADRGLRHAALRSLLGARLSGAARRLLR